LSNTKKIRSKAQKKRHATRQVRRGKQSKVKIGGNRRPRVNPEFDYLGIGEILGF
jgi:hypothetical protein